MLSLNKFQERDKKLYKILYKFWKIDQSIGNKKVGYVIIHPIIFFDL